MGFRALGVRSVARPGWRRPAVAAAACRRLLSVSMDAVPVIDASSLAEGRPEAMVDEVRDACSKWGFFQLTNHGVDPDITGEFQEHMHKFFALPPHVKDGIRRSADNSRGYFDDELTKRKRDWKEGLDFGITPGSRIPGANGFTIKGVSDASPEHDNLDGHNRFPSEEDAPGFRAAMWNYFVAMTTLAERLSQVMALGMGVPRDFFNDDLQESHTSFLRLNYYPVLDMSAQSEERPLGISPHTDAGYLTLLMQDDDCHSLQVRNRFDNMWHTVSPVPGALTVNTGDMAQIWSNGRYYAPEHRVLANTEKPRYSAPFFYNPGYRTKVQPLDTCVDAEYPLAYSHVYWGYFRWQRFSGDFADFGREVQISDFSVLNTKLRDEKRVAHQDEFMQTFDGNQKYSAA